ncbi:MAG: yceI-like domain protein [Burkholderiaceae bacterium]|nr:yceI-like domain protein [Burkholderiaceae bacterium]
MKQSFILVTALLASTVAQAAPEIYVIDNMHTYPRFEYSHFGFSTQQSRFDQTSGTITIDRVAKTGSMVVRIDARSVNTGSILNEHIQAEEFFDTKKYPEITFRSDDFRFDGERLVTVNGTLTIKGIARPVTLTVTSFHCMLHPMANKDACGANATTQLKRSDFNMGKYAPYVSDDVKLTISVEAIKP